MSFLTVVDLTKEYHIGDTDTKALNNVSFTLEKGDFVSIIGPSGSGKSTLLSLIGGLDRPSKGEIGIDGNSITKMNEDEKAIYRRSNMGIIYQFFNLIPILTVSENIALPLYLDKKPFSKDKVDKVLSDLGLLDKAMRYPNQLSGGEQQRVAIGRVIFAQPSLILADEPTGNLDSTNALEVMKLFQYMNQQLGLTIILVTHNQEHAKIASRIIELRDGVIVSDQHAKSLILENALPRYL